MRLISATTILLVFIAASINATNYFVSPTGDNGADGLTVGTAWQSIDNGELLGILNPGDTVSILPGNYIRSLSIVLGTDGLDGLPIVYRKLGKGKAVIDGDGNNIILISVEGNFVEVHDLELTNNGDNCIDTRGDGVVISGCYIHDVDMAGILIEGTNNLITKNTVYNAGDDGIRNTAVGMYGEIYNNTIYTSSADGIELLSGSSRVFNNIIAQNDVGIKGTAGDVVGFNNVWGNPSGDYSGITDSAGGISTLPKFVDPASGRFDLMIGSLEIDAGLNLGYPFSGAAPDIGAFEKFNIYYASPTGNNDFNGRSPDSAWVSIDNGDSLLFPGDTVYILPGTYTDSVVVTDSGLIDDYIVYMGVRDSCFLDAVSFSRAVRLNADYIYLSGINVAGSDSANIYIRGSFNQIRECRVDRAGLYGIHVAVGNENRFIRDVLSRSGFANLYLRDTDNLIYNCSFLDSTGYGIHSQGIANQTITNCIFLGMAALDNAIYANATSEVTYTIFFNNQSQASGGIPLGTGCLVADPQFIDVAAGNFRLQSTSPAIDAGIDVGLSFEGTAPDRGAYESGILASLEIVPVYDSLIADSEYQFTALGRDSHGFPTGVGQIDWSHTFSSGNIDSTGRFRPQLIGSGEISAVSSINGISAQSPTMTVVPGSLQNLTISPNRDTLSADDTRLFTATGIDQWGNEVTEFGNLSWQVINNIGTIDASGFFQAGRAGNGFISVTSDLGPSKISDTITVIPGVINDINIIPKTNVLVQNTSYQYAAYGIDADSNTVRDLTDSVIWVTTDLGGSITTGGFYTAGNNISPPLYYIIANYQGALSDSGTVSVISDGSLGYIRIETFDGSPFNDTALTTDNDNTALYCRGYTTSDVLLGDVSVTWSVLGADSIGAVNPGAGTSTTLRLTTPGTGQVRAEYSPSIVDSTGIITCTPGFPYSCLVAPDTATVSADSTLQFTLSLFDADGNPTTSGPAIWWSVIGGVGTIDAAGLFTPGAAGIGYVVGTCDGIADTSNEITVIPGILDHIRIIPDSVVVSADSTMQFVVNGYDAVNNLCDPGNITWELTAPVGTIDTLGWFDATTVGLSTVIATSSLGSVDTSKYLEVIPGRLAAMAVWPDSVTITTDTTIAFSVSGWDTDGNATSTGIINWTVIGSIGDVNSSGVFTPFTVGSGRMAAVSSIGGITDTNTVIHVNPGRLAQIAISPDTATLAIGDSLVFSAVGYDGKYNETDVGQLSWQVLGSIGIIDTTGLFIATGPGMGNINVISSYDNIEDITGLIFVEAMNISAIPLGDRYARPLQKDVPVLAFRLDNLHADDKTLEAISVRDLSLGLGTPSDLLANIDSIGLYLDTDGDSLLTPADQLLAKVAYSTTVIDLIPVPEVIPAGEGRNFILGADISLYPRDGDSLDVNLLSAGDILFSDSTIVQGFETINSLGYTIMNGMTRDQLVLTPVGSAVIYPSDTLYNCLTIDVPRNGYRADTLEIVNISNAGTAGEGDIDSLTLYSDNGNGVWGGPGEETLLGRLANTGDRWTRSGLNWPLENPLTRFYVAAGLSSYPGNGATISLYVPEDGLEVASDNDGPNDGPTIPQDTLTIATNEELGVVVVSIPFKKLVPGRSTGPLAGFALINGYGTDINLDSLILQVVMDDPRGATQPQLDSQFDSLMLYINRDNNFSILGSADSLLAVAYINNGWIHFGTGGLVIPRDGGIIGLTVAGRLSAINSRDGNSVNIGLESPSDLYFSQPATIIGGFPLANPVDFEIDAFPAEKITINPIEASTLFGGQTNRMVMDFVLPANGYATDRLQSLTIHNAGTLNEFEALLAVKLWVDVNNDSLASNDIMLGRFVPQSTSWNLSGLSYNIGLAGQRFYITVDVMSEQTEAGTLLFEIPTEGVYYLSSMTGPDDKEVGNPEAHLVFPSNRIFAISVPAGGEYISPKSTQNVVLSFALYNGYIEQDQTLEALTLSNISHSASNGAFADLEMGQVSLYLDTDSSRTFNGDSLIATGIFSNGRLQLGGLDIAFAPEALEYFFVVVDVALNLIDSDSLAVSVAQASDFQFQEAASIGGDLPLQSGDYLIVDGSILGQYGIIDNPARSVSPGDTDVTLLTFIPAVNGDQVDILQKLLLENIAVADPTDFPTIELWQDIDGDEIWQSSDALIGTFSENGGSWEIDGLSQSIVSPCPAFFIIADVADTTTANASFRARIPINGCFYASGNDGPIDSALTASNAVMVSTSQLAISAEAMEKTYSVGQPMVMQLTVINRSAGIIGDVTGEIVSAYDTNLVRLENAVSGPISLDPQAMTEFQYTFTALNPGTISWQARAIAPSIPDSSVVVEIPPVVIQAAPGPVTVQFINSIPTAVIKGQDNVFPLSIRYAHPDSQSTTASLRLDSLRLRIEDAAGNPISARSVFSRLSVVTGYTNLVNMETIPDQSDVWLVFNEPVVVDPGEEQRYSLLADIDEAATSGTFALALENAGSIPIADNNTRAPISLSSGTIFPLKTASCRIDDPSEHMFVAYESIAGPTANYGQQNVSVLRLDLRHPGAAGCSMIKFSSLEIGCLDDSASLIPAADLLNEITIKRQSSAIGRATIYDFGPTSTKIDFYSPVVLSPGDSESLTIEVAVQSQSIYDRFGLFIADSTCFTVRDMSSGSMLEATTDTLKLAAGVSTFPLASDMITLKFPAVAVEACPVSCISDAIISGSDSQCLLQTALHYPAGPDNSSVSINSFRLIVLDTLDHSLDPDLLFDRIGYSTTAGTVIYQPYILLDNGQVVFTLGDVGLTMMPGDTMTVSLVADIRPDVPYNHFLLRMADEMAVDIADLSDTLFNPGLTASEGCEATLPYETEVAHILMPAGRPGLRAQNLPVITVYPGQKQALVFDCQVSYESPTPEGDVVLKDLDGRIFGRTQAGLNPTNGNQVFETVSLLINGNPVPSNTVLSGDSMSIHLDNEYVISRGQNFTLSLTGDIKNDAILGNYLIRFEDSTFLNMEDRELTVPVYPVLVDALYPLKSAEISLTAADLKGSFRNFPNPFCPARGGCTRIAYTLPADAYVDIEIFSITGEAVTTVARNVYKAAASHSDDIWCGKNDKGLNVVSGTYFCRIKVRYTSGETDEHKIKIAVTR